ncbi:hypothetical protein MRB53_016336 [Persea americana]|uniref:Uncharacterized protein n=1 Tax=Persea americana TaxID=3435 RepID=A0ACC2M1M0_PERAE|nr:hypothetical protein MRB53_016336 [Persea americana]
MRQAVDYPRQGNSDDCGIFVMAVADHLVRGRAIKFSQSDMWFFRLKMVHDMYNNQVNRFENSDVGTSRS